MTHENSLAVEVMVWFLYFSVYPHLEEYGKFGVFDGLRFSLHLLVHDLAKKYEVPSLALLAKKHFITAVKKHWNMSIFHDCIPNIHGAQSENESTFRTSLPNNNLIERSKEIAPQPQHEAKALENARTAAKKYREELAVLRLFRKSPW